MYLLEFPPQGNSNEYTQHTIMVLKIKNIFLNYRYLLPDQEDNPQWLELPTSQTNFHGLKDVRAIEA